MVRHAKGAFSGAVADFDLELILHPDDAGTHLNRGGALAQVGDRRGAQARVWIVQDGKRIVVAHRVDGN